MYEPPEPSDGVRVLVDRVWPRGMTKERVNADVWLKEIGPSNELRKWFGHDPSRWSGFREKYFAELEAMPSVVHKLKELATEQDVTLLFSASDVEHNQAVALVEYLSS